MFVCYNEILINITKKGLEEYMVHIWYYPPKLLHVQYVEMAVLDVCILLMTEIVDYLHLIVLVVK